MPKREDETYRNIHPHPPTSRVSFCPKCGKKSLWYNERDKRYECLNLQCKASGRDLGEIASSPKPSSASSQNIRPHGDRVAPYKLAKKRSYRRKLPGWLTTLLLIFSLAIVGFGISALAVSNLPFGMLLGFSCVLGIEKWRTYQAQRQRGIGGFFGGFYRLLLNLGTLSLFGLIVWLGVKLFSGQYASNLLGGILLLLAELACFVWLCKVVAKNSWRWPSMKLTVFSLICVFLILSFTGVQPMASYKDNALTYIKNFVLWNTDTSDYISRFNEYRQSQGCAPLTFTDNLNHIAELRLAEIQENFSHYSPGHHNLLLGENIAQGVYSNSDALTCWKNSPGHNANMLNTDYRYTGYAAGGGCAVQVFSY
jgi:hypothetical protein